MSSQKHTKKNQPGSTFSFWLFGEICFSEGKQYAQQIELSNFITQCTVSYAFFNFILLAPSYSDHKKEF